MQPVANECILLLLYRKHILSTLYIYALKPSLVLFPSSLSLSFSFRSHKRHVFLYLSLSPSFPLFSHISIHPFQSRLKKVAHRLRYSCLQNMLNRQQDMFRTANHGAAIRSALQESIRARGGVSDVSITQYVSTLTTLSHFNHRFHNLCPQLTQKPTHIFHFRFSANTCG